MEDEEEDLPLLSQCWGTSTEDRGTQIRATVNDNSVGEGRMPLLHTVPRRRATSSDTSMSSPCGTAGSLCSTVGLGLVSGPTGSAEEAQSLFHSLNYHEDVWEPVSQPSLPTVREEEQDEGKEEEGQERISVEVQIGRKLREIGDQFQQDHLEMFMQYQRAQLPGWWQLASTLFNFLFPREDIGPVRALR